VVIKNKTRNTVITKNFLKKSCFGKLIGLINKKTPEAIVFNARFGIHTFFMKFPIDIIVCDKNNRIVFLKEDVKPYKIIFWNIKFDKVVELPAGSLLKSNTQRGDILEFI
jgi:uncharacterized membrane protein (UPF0127 family)